MSVTDAPFPPLDVDLPCAADGTDPEDWHPHPHGFGARHRRAVALCFTCPIQPQCFDYAMARPDLSGTFGGATEGQRRDLRRGGPRPRPPVTVHGYTGYGYGCKCDICKEAKATYQRTLRRARSEARDTGT